MANHHDIIKRYADRAEGKTTLNNYGRTGNVYAEGDTLYSYGPHFALATLLRDTKGAPALYILNGDTYSVSTAKHQGHTRAVIGNSDVPSIIVPYSALAGAGIDMASIKLIDSTPEENIRHDHESIEAPSQYAKRPWFYTETTNDDGQTVYRWTTYEHRLGGALFKALSNGRKRPAYFLSSFDTQEASPLYFLCQLPKEAKPGTINEAYEALKPEAVKVAESLGREITRQGDIFAIELPGITTRDLKKQGATMVKRGRLLTTNHEATQTAYLSDGTTLARGVLYHNPLDRQRDHARRPMGDRKTWHAIIKNTVPVAVSN